MERVRAVARAGVWLGLAVAVVAGTALSASATITIVAVDQGTGEVGAVGASCTPVDLAGTAVLAPSVGAATVLGPQDEAAAGTLLRKLDEGDASEVLRKVEGLDPGSGHRYAVAGLPPATAVSGVATAPPIAAAGRTTTAAGQGEWLRDRDAVRHALDAFDAAHGPLAERLLDALDAGNQRGGDRRCGRQRASNAFLIVTGPLGSVVIPARGSQAVRARQRRILNSLGGQIAADEIADRLLEAAALPRPVGPGAPSVYLSLLQPRRGFDAVTLLRRAYEETRAAPSTPTPTPTPARVGTATAGPTRDPDLSNEGPDGVTAILLLGGAAAIVLVVARKGRRRGTEQDGG